MFDQLLKVFEKIGTSAGWVVAIIQIPLWIAHIINSKKKEKANLLELNEEINELNEEIAKSKDKAYQWWQMLKELILMTKTNCKPVFLEFTDLYGGEEKFKDWWRLPEIPKFKKFESNEAE